MRAAWSDVPDDEPPPVPSAFASALKIVGWELWLWVHAVQAAATIIGGVVVFGVGLVACLQPDKALARMIGQCAAFAGLRAWVPSDIPMLRSLAVLLLIGGAVLAAWGFVELVHVFLDRREHR
jgi:hypothetical protein